MKVLKLDEIFPIYLIKDFEPIEDTFRKILISVVLENKKRNHYGMSGGSFLIDEDYQNFFDTLYDKFLKLSLELFGDLKILNIEKPKCWSYTSNKFDCGPGRIHNHIGTSTINSVYYLNIPDSANINAGSISFFLNKDTFTYRPKNEDLLIFPNYLDHKINFLDDPEYRISINMEIICEESAEEIFSKVNF